MTPHLPHPPGDALAEALARCEALARENDRLRRSETRFRHMADATPDVVWMTEVAPERVIYASPSFEQIWGRPVQHLYDDPHLWVACIHPDDRPRIGSEFGRWLAGARANDRWEAEFRIVQPNGTVRWIHERGFMIPAQGGEPARVSGVSTDITERRLAELALRASEERFALAVAGSNDGIWDWDIATGQMFMSERAQRIFGIAMPGITTRPRAEWRAMIKVHPDDVDPQLGMIENYVLGKAPAYDGEWRMRHPDGSHRWVRIRGTCVRDMAGRATRLAGSVSDVDARKRAEEALRQSQRLEALGTLAGGIAHDFNNILGAILGFGEMMMRNTRPDSRMRRDLGFVLAAGERGRALVERILAFSRTGAAERVPVALESVVREVLNLLSPTLPEGMKLAPRLEAGDAAAVGDSTQVHQVVVNLVTNAMQAMPAGGTVQVALDPVALPVPRLVTTGPLAAGDYVVLTVTDTGIGIPSGLVARIFDPFFTTKEPGAGTGLGLSLVHGIVTGMGGAIDVATSVQTGSTFTVWFPRSSETAGAAPNRTGALPRGRRERILVVDDEAALVQLTTDTLAGLGYQPEGFTSSADALQAFEADPGRFDAVITDDRMPQLTGTSLMASVRARRADLPVLLVTGYPAAAVTRRARAGGAAAVLGKPLSARELATALARSLGRDPPGA
ncbi:MAG: PAS domain-containing protein [Rhizobacter sp.]